MNYNTRPGSARNANRATKVIVPVAALLLAGCASEPRQSPDVLPTTRAVAPPIGTEVSPSRAPESFPPQWPGSKVMGCVCDAFVVVKQDDGSMRLIGRPVLDGKNIPQEVDANYSGVEVIPAADLSHNKPMDDKWFTLQGQPETSPNCATQPLYNRELTQPNGNKLWVTSSKPDAAIPRTWDAKALNPDGFAGVSLDYGPMSAFDIAQVMTQAQHDTQRATATASPTA